LEKRGGIGKNLILKDYDEAPRAWGREKKVGQEGWDKRLKAKGEVLLPLLKFQEKKKGVLKAQTGGETSRLKMGRGRGEKRQQYELVQGER